MIKKLAIVFQFINYYIITGGNLIVFEPVGDIDFNNLPGKRDVEYW